MSRGQNPLMLMMALSLPGAAHALGLGEIHVDSALNEPLAAEIEIVGATAEELSGLTATIANRDTFARFGAERPAFLASATFKVSRDVNGRPVLSIRSADSFTEPVVNLLVDLRWHNGEVIRQYSLLLDPAGFPSATQKAAALPPAIAFAAPVTAAIAAESVADSSPDPRKSERKMTQLKVGAKATLRGVAWRVGARSDIDLKKTMLAIFRANPAAFDGNINRMHLGSVLMIPTIEQVEAVSQAEANKEIDSQMAAWRAAPGKSREGGTTPVTADRVSAIAAVAPAQPSAAIAASAADGGETAALNLRVQSLEQDLHDMQGKLKRERDLLLDVQAKVRYAEAEAARQPADSELAAAPSWRLPSVLGGLALIAGALGAIYARKRRRPMTPKQAAKIDLEATDVFFDEDAKDADESVRNAQHPITSQEPVATEQESTPASSPANTQAPFHTPIAVNEEELRAAYEDTLDLSGETAILATEAAESDETANLPAATVSMNTDELRETVIFGPEALQVDATKLDYNLTDLDMTAQHVQMPSKLHEHVVVKERRTNLVDVLKMAIEREPDRNDLSMKLLETYYAAAATNRQGFLEVVQKLSRNRDRLAEGEWAKIAFMGKHIAADNALFSSEVEAEDDTLVNCA